MTFTLFGVLMGLSAAVIIGGFYLVARMLQPAWSQRDEFYRLDGRWNQGYLFATLISLITYFVLFNYRDNPQVLMVTGQPIHPTIILSMVAISWVFTFSAWTDALIHRAPMEIAHLGMLFGLLLFIAYCLDTGNWFVFVTFAIWSIIPALLYFQPGMGLADIRLLWVISFAASWWVGWFCAFILFGVAAVIQLIMIPIFQKMKWGKVLDHKPPKINVQFRKLWKKIYRKSKVNISGEPEKRYFTPLIPALAIAYVIILTALLVNGNRALIFNGGFGLFFV